MPKSKASKGSKERPSGGSTGLNIDFSKLDNDNEPTITELGGPHGKYMCVRLAGAFREVVNALRLRFYFAPGHSKEAQARWLLMSLPATTNVRSAAFIILPARPGEPGFTEMHEAILRYFHARPPGMNKLGVYTMAWVEECLRVNMWVRDDEWKITLPDIPDDKDRKASNRVEYLKRGQPAKEVGDKDNFEGYD